MRYARNDAVLDEVVDGRHLLIAPDGSELLTLNETGSVVWDALAEPVTLEVVVSSLGAAVQDDIDPDRLAADVRTFLDELRSAGVVVTVDA